MRTGWLGIVGAVAFALAAGSALAQAPRQVVQGEVVKLDYLRYEGRYYEIARLPIFNERNCAADVVMTLLRRSEGDVSIVYQCFAQDRSWLMDIGRLDISHGDTFPGELYVRPDWIGWSPWHTWGTYRLIEASEDFSYLMMGDAGGSRLWILSRTRKMNDESYARLVARAAQRGYDTRRLVRAVQNGL